MSEYLFAYGTLRPGRAPAKIARIADRLRPVGEGSIRGVLYDLGNYPGAVPDAKAASRIFGSVLELPNDPDLLRRLDAYECCDPQNPEASEYTRVRQVVDLAAGDLIECWFYRYNGKPEPSRAIASGIWRRHTRKTAAES